MARNPWIVEPDTVKVDLTWQDGTEARPLWVTLKKRLNVGEARAMMAAVSTVSQPIMTKAKAKEMAPTARIEWTEYSFARMAAYVQDWSLAHEADKDLRLPPTRASFDALHPDLFNLIDEAIDQHVEAQDAEKKARSGSPAPEVTSA